MQRLFLFASARGDDTAAKHPDKASAKYVGPAAKRAFWRMYHNVSASDTYCDLRDEAAGLRAALAQRKAGKAAARGDDDRLALLRGFGGGETKQPDAQASFPLWHVTRPQVQKGECLGLGFHHDSDIRQFVFVFVPQQRSPRRPPGKAPLRASVRPKSARREYLRQCSEANAVPESAGIICGGSHAFANLVAKHAEFDGTVVDLSHKGLGDARVVRVCNALAAALVSHRKRRALAEAAAEAAAAAATASGGGGGGEASKAAAQAKAKAKAAAAEEAPIPIKALNLCGNRLSCVAVRAVATVVCNGPNVTEVNLSNNKIGPAGCAAIGAAACTSVLSVNLSACAIGNRGLARFVAALREGARRERLAAKAAAAGRGGGGDAATGTSSSGADSDGRGCASPGTWRIPLAELAISDNGISDAAPLCAYLKDRRRCAVQSLDLSWNALRGRGALAVAVAVLENRSLVSLNLSNNSLGRAEAPVPGAAGAGLGLFENPIEVIANVICIHPSLLHLDLSHCQMDAKGCSMITGAASSAARLLALHLGGNLFSPAVDKWTEGCGDSTSAAAAARAEAAAAAAAAASDSSNSKPSGPERRPKREEGAAAKASAARRRRIVHIHEVLRRPPGGTRIHDAPTWTFTRFSGAQGLTLEPSWVERPRCWICERHKRVVFVYIPEISGPEPEPEKEGQPEPWFVWLHCPRTGRSATPWSARVPLRKRHLGEPFGHSNPLYAVAMVPVGTLY